MEPATELSIELATQELLAPFTPSDIVEVENICEIDPSLRNLDGANSAPATPQTSAPAADDTAEIELTAEEIDALLEQGELG